MSPERIVFFDGVCTLCNGTVRRLLARDPRRVLSFALLQSPLSAKVLADYPVDPSALDAVIFLDEGRCYQASSAALRIARYLSFPWSLLALLLVVPRPLRDLVYRWIARNRYSWFGREAQCVVPSPEDRDRFLELRGGGSTSVE